MLKISRLADYAVVILVTLGGQEGVVTSPFLATQTGVPEPTVAKVLKMLASGGLVTSQRGARGGYRLSRPLSEISVASVIMTVDGPIALTACVDGGECDAGVSCRMCGSWDAMNSAIRDALEKISLDVMQNSRSKEFVISAFSGNEMPTKTMRQCGGSEQCRQ
ncbi:MULTISPECIES: SUF system Fe-S cluster assembly regulator [Acetobacter]|uniref:SUF system Fe-S cluster assembly regulator n=1 Tax=Acetobacter thailandicus TaxID=1502842 RepID=A0ABT3QAU5_9PROT|nr:MULTISPECIES: SUF system Fe-S cluster assembly regulator [Acetobacter]MBS0959407.1 SUF system Fe-S cluster assembly regulator [Acetobacter thailandicus]MBS0980594.1 SUF system Fe-S cluster assembly regulator [Acetobacter thailandicus]MBS0984700.1 SUF system Fe-S cluster assembly regulator [Acetobacter thailandicus]MBS1003781.1 SUF system Fe-S cluster assembly regulator [Acetobacter thailandicus]MCX2562408.1 SUF system Fe-S cluster assembly regulator [Acetobacter thailandicus]